MIILSKECYAEVVSQYLVNGQACCPIDICQIEGLTMACCSAGQWTGQQPGQLVVSDSGQ